MGRGLLVFKGAEKVAKKNKRNSKHSQKAATTESGTAVVTEHEATNSPRKLPPPTAIHLGGKNEAAALTQPPRIQDGMGVITTSGTVVTGHDTRFQRELAVGDAILVKVTDTKTGEVQQEMRVLTICLSDTSLNLSSSFSQNLSQPTAFQFIRKPRDRTRDAATAHHKAAEDASVEGKQASGLYGSTSELVYREKTEHGSYRIKRVEVGRDLTRDDLLEMRTKKKHDKYC
jgi:hypothetical protein